MPSLAATTQVQLMQYQAAALSPGQYGEKCCREQLAQPSLPLGRVASRSNVQFKWTRQSCIMCARSKTADKHVRAVNKSPFAAEERLSSSNMSRVIWSDELVHAMPSLSQA